MSIRVTCDNVCASALSVVLGDVRHYYDERLN